MMIFGVTPMFGGGARGPIEFVSSSINQSTTITNTVAAPASISAGDLLVMVGILRTNRAISTAPSGWTAHLNDATSPGASVYSKIATGSEPADYSWTWAGTADNTIAILCYSAANAVDVVGARTRATTNTSTAASLTATQAGALIGVFGLISSSTVTTPPSGLTQRSLQTAAQPAMAVYDLIPSPAGASTAQTLVWSSSTNNVGWAVQIY
jgi:hypothetical protein